MIFYFSNANFTPIYEKIKSALKMHQKGLKGDYKRLINR